MYSERVAFQGLGVHMNVSVLAASPRGPIHLLHKYPVLAFVLLADAITWSFWIPMSLLGLPALNSTSVFTDPWVFLFSPILALGVTAPAFLLTALIQGKESVLRLLGRFVVWRVGLQWYLFALFAVPGLAILIGFAISGSKDVFEALSPRSLIWYPLALILILPFGPFWEEAGWRGFVLPRLQHRWGPVIGALITGFCWGQWHFMIFVPSLLGGAGVFAVLQDFCVFIAFAIAGSFVVAFVFNNTKGSLLLTILIHLTLNGTIVYVNILSHFHFLSVAATENIIRGCFFSAFILAPLVLTLTSAQLGGVNRT
jgi:membrane protease YdiL (CAAX protease family)